MTVLISTKTWLTGDESAYHTDEDCRHVGPNHRELPEDHSLVERLELCDYCADEWDGVERNGRECPYCRETFGNLPQHLPCEKQ